MSKQVKTPVLTSTLFSWIPHRPPMIWIDEVISFGSEGGECLVHLKGDGAYLTEGKLRPSSLIEFIAQAQAFVGICNAKAVEDSPAPFQEAFLVAVTDANLEAWNDFQGAIEGTTLLVKVSAPRTMGPIHMFSGSVWTTDNQCLGSAKIKAFINSSKTH